MPLTKKKTPNKVGTCNLFFFFREPTNSSLWGQWSGDSTMGVGRILIEGHGRWMFVMPASKIYLKHAQLLSSWPTLWVFLGCCQLASSPYFYPDPFPIHSSLAAQVIDLKLAHSSFLATALSRLRKKSITCCGHEGTDPCLPLCPHFVPFSFICYPDLVVS